MGINFQWSKEEDGGSEYDDNLIKNYDISVLTNLDAPSEFTLDNSQKENMKEV